MDKTDQPDIKFDLSKLFEAAKQILDRKRELLLNTITPGLPMWEMNFQPFPLGTRFVSARSWQREIVATDPAYAGRQLIQIDPGIAFGYSHATTELCIEGLEQYWHGGRLLDIGTGTGILAMAASLLHPQAQIDAFDISPEITDNARIHLELNQLDDRIDLRQATIEDYPVRAYDAVVGNLLPDLHKLLKKEIVARVKPGGILIVSGFEKEDIGSGRAWFDWELTYTEGMSSDEIAALFQELGMELIEQKTLRDYAALILRAPEESL